MASCFKLNRDPSIPNYYGSITMLLAALQRVTILPTETELTLQVYTKTFPWRKFSCRSTSL